MRFLRFLPKLKKPRLLLRRVMGESMLPTIQPGKVIVGLWPLPVKPGDIVIVRHEGIDKVKRVKGVNYEKLYLLGDNPSASTDSRDFGWIEMKCVLAKVIQF
jgi:nickel-type superoxide dismutase maturation protease